MAKASDNPFPSLLLVEQSSAPATPAAGRARLYRGTDNKLYLLDDTGAAVEVGAGSGTSGGGGALTVVKYNPAGNTLISTTSDASVTDVDATNLAVTFTAPTSGKVMIDQTGFAARPDGTIGDSLSWCLRAATTVVTDTQAMVAQTTSGTALHYGRVTHRSFVTGLTPGASYTYKWGHAANNGKVGKTGYGGVYGPAVMVVWPAP